MSELIDNRSERIRKLEEIIKQLHGGAAPEKVKAQLKEIVQQTDATEIAAMEQQLIAGGMPLEEVRSMCDLHAQVLSEIMTEPVKREVAPGHPVDTFQRENEAIHRSVEQIRTIIGELRRQTAAGQWQEAVVRLRQGLNELMDIDKHYQRKENLLFTRLERHGISGPSKVMWAKDDEVRQLLKRGQRMLAQDSLNIEEVRELIATTIEPVLEAVAGMIYKEENILLPMALGTLTDQDWAEIWRDSPRYGWCLVEPREGYRPSTTSSPSAEAAADSRTVTFPTGTLTPEQLQGLLAALPVELTFVDADDNVRYFSEGPEQIFKRSKVILGRKVQNCHPPASVHVVQKILDDFRGAKRNVAEFWLNSQGKFVHIRYFAVRDPEGKYLGTLEVTQDLTRLRTLEGQRRLLQDD
jgi:DUF438 domain-containing protein